MTFKGTSGTGKAKASRSTVKAKAPVEVSKSLSGKSPDSKPGRGNNRTLWIILIILAVLALCCVVSLVLAWNLGDGFMDFMNQMQSG